MTNIPRVLYNSPEHNAIPFLGDSAGPHDPVAVDYGPKGGNSVVHEYRCAICGAESHCPVCRMSAHPYLGHMVFDDVGTFYSCQEPERLKAKQKLEQIKREVEDLKTLRRLITQYRVQAVEMLLETP